MSLCIYPLADGQAVLGSNTSDQVFGPIFRSVEDAERFVDWVEHDVRQLTNPQIGLPTRDPMLFDRYNEWLDLHDDA